MGYRFPKPASFETFVPVHKRLIGDILPLNLLFLVEEKDSVEGGFGIFIICTVRFKLGEVIVEKNGAGERPARKAGLRNSRCDKHNARRLGQFPDFFFEQLHLLVASQGKTAPREKPESRPRN
jgi:hypothetical protein